MSEQPFGTESEPAGTSPGVPQDAAAAQEPAPQSPEQPAAAPAAEPSAPAAEDLHNLIPINHPGWLHDLLDGILAIVKAGGKL